MQTGFRMSGLCSLLDYRGIDSLKLNVNAENVAAQRQQSFAVMHLGLCQVSLGPMK